MLVLCDLHGDHTVLAYSITGLTIDLYQAPFTIVGQELMFRCKKDLT